MDGVKIGLIGPPASGGPIPQTGHRILGQCTENGAREDIQYVGTLGGWERNALWNSGTSSASIVLKVAHD